MKIHVPRKKLGKSRIEPDRKMSSETNFRSAAIQKHAQKNVFLVFHSAILTQKNIDLFAQKAYFVVVRGRWRSGYLWGLSLFGTTFLRSVFS